MKSRAVASCSAGSLMRENQFPPSTRSDSIAWCTGCTPSTRGTGTGPSCRARYTVASRCSVHGSFVTPGSERS